MTALPAASDDADFDRSFGAAQQPLAAMLESTAGLAGGTRDALTRFTHPAIGPEGA